MATSAIYRPLNAADKEIRILVVQPDYEPIDDGVNCELKHISLMKTLDLEHDQTLDERRDEYETISYCWGNDVERAAIRVQGHELVVSTSVEQVLRRIRLPDKPRSLWIDAVCINQDDLEERSQQVAIMADVYRNAKQNIVYLGARDVHTDSALRSIDSLMKTDIAAVIAENTSLIDVFYARYGSDHVPVWSDTASTVEIDQVALTAFYQRPWFRRLWVIQEIAMAKSSIGVCGHRIVNMSDVLIVAKWLQVKYSTIQPSLRSVVYPAARIFNFADPVHSILRSGRFDVTLSMVLNCTRDFEYTEPLDIVYAVTSLVDWPSRTISGTLPTRLQPNYTRTLAQLLTNAAHIVVFSESSLLLFSEISHRSHEDIHFQGLPSWVPRWQRRRDVIEDTAPFLVTFSSSRGTEWMSPAMDAAFDTDPFGHLTLDGILVDTITQVHVPLESFDWSNFHDDYIAPAQKYSLPADPTHDETDKIYYTLTAGAWFDGRPISKDQIGICQEICTRLSSSSIDVPNDLPRFSISDGPPQISLDEKTRTLLEGKQALLNACNCRIIATTSRNFLCLAPSVAREGDLIVVLFGGHTPFVLRPVRDDKYELMGPCYVHELMNGEAVQEWKARGSPGQTFTLV